MWWGWWMMVWWQWRWGIHITTLQVASIHLFPASSPGHQVQSTKARASGPEHQVQSIKSRARLSQLRPFPPHLPETIMSTSGESITNFIWYMSMSPAFSMQIQEACQGGPLPASVCSSIKRTIDDWNECPLEDINALKDGFGCAGLSITYKGKFDLRGIQFAVFISQNSARWFFYAVEHGWFVETGGPFS